MKTLVASEILLCIQLGAAVANAYDATMEPSGWWVALHLLLAAFSLRVALLMHRKSYIDTLSVMGPVMVVRTSGNAIITSEAN